MCSSRGLEGLLPQRPSLDGIEGRIRAPALPRRLTLRRGGLHHRGGSGRALAADPAALGAHSGGGRVAPGAVSLTDVVRDAARVMPEPEHATGGRPPARRACGLRHRAGRTLVAVDARLVGAGEVAVDHALLGALVVDRVARRATGVARVGAQYPRADDVEGFK